MNSSYAAIRISWLIASRVERFRFWPCITRRESGRSHLNSLNHWRAFETLLTEVGEIVEIEVDDDGEQDSACRVRDGGRPA